MAIIREYTAPSGEELHASDLGETSMVRAARNIEANGDQAANEIKRGAMEAGQGVAQYFERADKKATFDEISQGAQSFAQLRNGTDAIANQAFKDPNSNTDPDLQNKITQQVNPLIDKWTQGFHSDGGRRWAMEQAATYREHFATRLAADTSTMSGIAAEGHLNEWLKNSSQIVERDPTAIAQERAMVMPTIDGLISNLPGMSAVDAQKFRMEHSQKMLQTIDTTALNSLAMKSPGAARSQFEGGQFPNADPMHAEQILKMGDSLARSNAAADRANQEFAQHQANERAVSGSVQTLGQLTKDAQSGDPAALQKLKDFGTNILLQGPKTGMKGEAAWQVHQMTQSTIQSLGKPDDVASRPDVLADFNKRISADGGPQVTPSEIVKANNEGQLSWRDSQEKLSQLNVLEKDPTLQGSLKDFNESMKSFEPILKGVDAAGIPGFGASRANEFYNDHMKAFQDGIQQGLKPGDMLNASSKDYIFRDVKDYMATPEMEQSIFGKPFTLMDQSGPVVPTSVRMMEAWRQQSVAAQKKRDDMDKITGTGKYAPTRPEPTFPEVTLP